MDNLNTFSEMPNITNRELSTTESDQLPQAGGTQAMFGVIAALSVILNLFFCLVMIRKPAMLKTSHNILLFSLAITDLLTGNL